MRWCPGWNFYQDMMRLSYITKDWTCARSGIGPKDDAPVVGDADDGGFHGVWRIEIGDHGERSSGIGEGRSHGEKKKQ
ncbi:hypothetical protein COCNU_01G008110 [Cocos nucifera]|uniref:Uncharacterized protein n=1 Tax=Cocos nucifera TaxID=13894 RepID=A0A8K0MUI4_COCNU|nr:hypothetical protein COCNU_01G008110 [Cocos nucifera]